MVKDIKEFSTELSAQALPPFEILGHGKIDILESRVAEDVASHCSESAQRWRDQDRIAICIAAERCQRVACVPNRSSIESQRLSAACGVARIVGISAAREEWDSNRGRFETLRVAEKIPAVGNQLTRPADVGARIHYPERLRAIQADNRVDLPAFEHLAVAIFP